MIAPGVAGPTLQAGFVDGDWDGIEDSHCLGAGGVGNRQSDLGGGVDGIGDEVASRVLCRAVVRWSENAVTLTV